MRRRRGRRRRIGRGTFPEERERDRLNERFGRYDNPFDELDTRDFSRDYRGSSFEPSEEDWDPLTTLSTPSATAATIRRIHGRGQGQWGREARGRYRRPARKYAQHAVMLLANPTLPATERAALLQSLQQSGAPAYGGDAVRRAAAFGPGALPGNVGLIGGRGGGALHDTSLELEVRPVGIIRALWPVRKPIYKRPAFLIALGLAVGYFLFGKK
ncbi:MAG: hypothetical protein ABIO70_15925 [Pseudomonadota bacterium]